MAVRRSGAGSSEPRFPTPGRRVSLPSQLYWRVIDARRMPTTGGRRRDVLDLIHRVVGATVTSLYCGNSSPQLVEQIGEPVVDVKHDDRARAALSTRRTVTLDAGDRCELPDGTVFSDGVWRPLDVQGINVGLLRLLAEAPGLFPPGTLTLVDFIAAWLASSVVTDGQPPVWVNPALGAATGDDDFDGDLDDIAGLVVECAHAQTAAPAEERPPSDESGGAGRLTLVV